MNIPWWITVPVVGVLVIALSLVLLAVWLRRPEGVFRSRVLVVARGDSRRTAEQAGAVSR